MIMKTLIQYSLLFLSIGFFGCDVGEAEDPGTVKRSDLTPPGQLITVTGDGAIELRWESGNAEEKFQGYQVFAVAKDLSEITAPS